MKRVSLPATILFAVGLGVGGCAWWEGMTGQQASVTPPQGAANYDNMMAAINNQPKESRDLAGLGNVSPDKVIIANANMMARGGSARQLDNAMKDNAAGITAIRRQINETPSLKQVLSARNVPVNNVLALDVTSGGGVVVYALPPVQTGETPEQAPRAGY